MIGGRTFLPFLKEYRNPVPTVDVILQKGSGILMVRRRNDPFRGKLALPGGFINEGETAEDAARREILEETSLEVEPVEILGVYSDPARDPRRHILSIVFIGIVTGGTDRAGDDAAGIEWLDLEHLNSSQLAFDHEQIIRDYKKWKVSGGSYWSSKRRNE
jgi:ADP-ribose pyrophosphatase YjhB (NUDIX family)